MSYVRGDFGSLKAMADSMKGLPRYVSEEVAKRGASVLASMVESSWSSGSTVWGAARPVSTVTGASLTLVKSGKARSGVTYEVSGSRIKVKLPVDYAKFLVGKYKVMPNVGMPMTWKSVLWSIRDQVVIENFGEV